MGASMSEDIVLKGDRDGLLLVISSRKPFTEVLDVLRAKLETSRDFFSKSPTPLVIRYKGNRELTFGENNSLSDLLKEFGLVYNNSFFDEPSEAAVRAISTPSFLPEVPFNAPVDSEARPALIIRRTVRGGQLIKYNGTVIVFGDVNPSAHIMAESDIFVAGSTRGILHAGCLGDRNATVVAANFSGGQIRIADLIVRAPDDAIESGSFDMAKIHDNHIVIDSVLK